MNLKKYKKQRIADAATREQFSSLWNSMQYHTIQLPDGQYFELVYNNDTLIAYEPNGAQTGVEVVVDYETGYTPQQTLDDNIQLIYERLYEEFGDQPPYTDTAWNNPGRNDPDNSWPGYDNRAEELIDSVKAVKIFLKKYSTGNYTIGDAREFFNTVKKEHKVADDLFFKYLKFKVTDSVRIQDLSKDQQTDEIKTELYKLTQQFVYKYQRQYFVQFKGDLDDLVTDYYVEFMTEKAREDGKEQSLLDKFDPNVTTLAYLVKVAVIRKLIDDSRSDKGEINYKEKYDEETGDLSLDWLASHLDKDDVSVDDIVFDEDDIFEARDKYAALSPEERQHFLRMYKEVKNVLSPNFQEFFEDLVNSYQPEPTDRVASSMTDFEKSFISDYGDAIRLKSKKTINGATFSTGTVKRVDKTIDDVKQALDNSEDWTYEPVGNSKANFRIVKKNG